MPSDGQTESNQPVTLDAAKVLFVDPQSSGWSQLNDTLRLVGFRSIEACENFDEFKSLRFEGDAKPDLVLLDIDAERDAGLSDYPRQSATAISGLGPLRG